MVKIENVIERMKTFLSINTTHMPQCNATYETNLDWFESNWILELDYTLVLSPILGSPN